MSRTLASLCEHYGVLAEFQDTWGTRHKTSEAVQRALLQAMGVPAGTEEELAGALLELERRAWERPLPPVQVTRETQAHRIELTLPLAEEHLSYRWRLLRESGCEDQGEFTPAALEEAGHTRIDGQSLIRRVLVLPLTLETGYHRLRVERLDGAGRQGEMSYIVAPVACYQPAVIRGEGRVWGFSAQLYGLRSDSNWGIGDFGDLRRMLEFCAEAGADTVLVNPLHARFQDEPEHACPYSPSNREYFNTLYLEVETLEDFGECADAQTLVRSPAFQALLRSLRAAEQVDYVGVATLKANVLDLLYQHFRRSQLASGSARGKRFRAFQAAKGKSLRDQGLFNALQEAFREKDPEVWGWPVWPEPYRNPKSIEVAAFLDAHLERVEYFEYLQWQVAEQLAGVGTRSWELGLGLGVLLDLAIGAANGGAATWAERDLFAVGAAIGAPPDRINLMGQDWGLPPWIPHHLAAMEYRPFIELLRTHMAIAGGLRMDHVMGLSRLFWVAQGLPVGEGAYVAYPFADLLGILALESQRNACMVMGEDLGTVPEEVRQALQPAGVLSTRILAFERGEDGGMKPPQAYPRQAVAAVSSHDLPTLAGFWQGLDIDLRQRLHLYPSDEVLRQQIIERAQDRVHMLLALEGEGLVPAGSGLHPADFQEMTPALAASIYTYLARTPSKVLLLQLEDGFGVREQPNLPGSMEPAYPCWRLKLPVNLEAWPGHAYLEGILQALRQERPRSARSEFLEGRGVRSWIPRATYRLQMNSDFTLQQAKALLPYLDELGVSHGYLSPLLKARPGSRHGYDITDHASLNPEIASPEDFEEFAAALKERGMGQIMDVVPNHMGIMGDDNHWWLDVLENGQASPFAAYFDIDWHPISGELWGRVLLPVLGDGYGAILEDGGLKLAFDAEQGSFSVFYSEHRFPVDPREYPRILGPNLARLEARLGAGHPTFLELQSLLASFGHLPPRDQVSPEAVAERRRDKELHKQRLAALFSASADLAQFLLEEVAGFNSAGPGVPPFEAMHGLLEAQAYRLAYWRVAADEINYRRFFDINTLAALNMDNPEVFESTHRLVGEWLARGCLNGLRIDHPDGLLDPGEYFERLQALAAQHAPRNPESQALPLYLVVEKILALHEHLPEAWAIHGTTGYDFAAVCDGIFVDQVAETRFTELYDAFIGEHPDLEAMERTNKYLVMETLLAGELQVLATRLTRLAKGDRRTRDFTFISLRKALAGMVASFPVYRTYVASFETSKEDVRYVEWAAGVARKHSLTVDASLFDFVRDVLLLRQGEGKGEAYQKAVLAFALKFQQYSGPVMAKALEDTTFYQYNRLVSLNEVGGDPRRFGASLAAFHQENQERARRWPHAMLASSTHDSKRSGDVRARISVLSEWPEAWAQAIARWSRLNRPKQETGQAISANDEYLLYQTLLGVWPFAALDPQGLAELTGRVEAYMLKTGREAKVHSSWLNPDAEYEEATRAFVRKLLAPESGNPFLRDFQAFQEPLARVGALNSLAQQLLKLTSPGVPDIYQGTELWDFSLADPDNRRSVDYPQRQAALESLQALHAEKGAALCARQLLDHLPDGRIKLYLIWKILACRREQEATFRDGAYLPLAVGGRRAENVVAFARQLGSEALVVVTPRLIGGLLGMEGELPVGEAVWEDTWIEVPPESISREWTNLLTDEKFTAQDLGEGQGLLLGALFRDFPYALLRRGGA